jgi:hypothetical protein
MTYQEHTVPLRCVCEGRLVGHDIRQDLHLMRCWVLGISTQEGNLWNPECAWHFRLTDSQSVKESSLQPYYRKMYFSVTGAHWQCMQVLLLECLGDGTRIKYACKRSQRHE